MRASAILANLPQVRAMKLLLRLWSPKCKYLLPLGVCRKCVTGRHPFLQDHQLRNGLDGFRVRRLATSLFRFIFDRNPAARLDSLELCFQTRLRHDLDFDFGLWRDNLEWPVRVKRMERDDALGPEDGGFEVECATDWANISTLED